MFLHINRDMLFLILICLVSSNSAIAENESAGNRTVGEFLNKQIEIINNATSELIVHDIVTFRAPPLSLQCNKTDTDQIKIIQNNDDFIYLLSVNELLAIDVSKNKELRMHFVGTLLQINEPVEEVKIEKWQSSFIIVVRMAKMLHIYLARNDFVGEPINPIQRINLASSADRFVMFRKMSEVFLVTYGIRLETENELSYYRWSTSFFGKEYTESLNLPNKNNLFVYNQGDKDPLILAIGYGNMTRVVILKLDLETNRWVKLQSMHFKQDYIKHYVVDEKLYLIACSTDAFCAIYKWDGLHFRRHLKLSNQVYEEIKNVHYNHDLVITESPQRTLWFLTLNNLASMKPGLIRQLHPDVSTYAIYKSKIDQKLSYAEFMFKKTVLEMNFYEIDIEKVQERANNEGDTLLQNPVECVGKLKAILKSRMPKVQGSQLNVQRLQSQENKLQLENKKIFRAKRVNLKDTVLSHLKMPYKIKSNANGLLESAASANAQIEVTRISLMRSKMPGVEGRAEEDLENAMENLVVENLIYSGKEPIFNDLALKSHSLLSFVEDLSLETLTANKLVVSSNRINEIPLSQLINATSVKQVSGKKVFSSLNVKNLSVKETLNNVPTTILDPSENEKPLELAAGFEFVGDINVKHLKVKSLNGFNVSSLVSDVFLVGNRNTIRGDLTLQNAVTVDSLVTGKLMEVPVENLMTKSTEQKVTADVFINKFFVRSLRSDLINGEKLRENAALANEDNLIEVPTQFMEINILKNLNIKDESDDEERARAGLTNTIEVIKRHVIGTKTSDLSQIYSGKVVIQGSLTVKNIKFITKKARIFVSGSEVPQNISANFWMKNRKQEVQVESFVVNNQIKTENIVTNLLNESPINDFVLLDSELAQGPLNLKFEKASVVGDVKGHKDNIPSLIFHLNFTSVPRTGGFKFVQSSIAFRGDLKVRKLETKFLNEVPVTDLVHKGQQTAVFTSPKTLTNLDVKNIHVDNEFTAKIFNNLNLQKFTSDAIRIDQPINIKTLKLKTFTANILLTNFFEDYQLDEFISNLEKEFQLKTNGPPSVKRNVRIIGNANFLSDVLIETINTQTNFNELLNLLVLKNEKMNTIGGAKFFQQGLIVTKSVEGKTFNDFSLDRLIHQSLSKRDKQTISGELFVKKLRAKSLRTKLLNGIGYDQFVDKNWLEFPLFVNLNVDELHVNHVTSRSSSHDVGRMIRLAKFPERIYWNYVKVAGGSKIPLQTSSILDRLSTLAVLKTGPPQVITGRVEVFTEKFFIKYSAKPDYVVIAQSIPIDLRELFLDSLKSESSGKSQTIRGIKTFQAPIYANHVKIEPQAYFGSNKINNVDVLELNRTIMRSNDVVQSKTNFESIHADDIVISGKMNGIPWNSMLFVTKNDLRLPQLTIDYLEVVNLDTHSLNYVELNHFLHHRMRKHGYSTERQLIDSFLTFDSLEILNETVMASINDVGIDDAVYSTSDQQQDVTGHKWFAGNIFIKSPSTITKINGEDFSDFMKNSVRKTDDHLQIFMELQAVELKKGLRAQDSINGYRIDDLLSSDIHTPKLADLTTLIRGIRQQIHELNKAKRARSAKPKRLLYIDFDPSVQFEFAESRERSSEGSCGEKVVEPSKFNAILVRDKRDENMTTELSTATFVTSPNFDCRRSDGNVKEFHLMMKFKDRNKTTVENFRFDKSVVDVKYLEPRKAMPIFMMILTMKNEGSKESEIVIEKFDESVHSQWFEHQKITGLNSIAKSAMIETLENKFLVVSSFTDTTPATSDFVKVFELDPKTDKFIENPRLIPGEKFDIILGVNVAPKGRIIKPRSFLLVAREGGKMVYIYRLKQGTTDFVFLRKIAFDTGIIEVVVLQIMGDVPYFIVTEQSGKICIFEWRGVESWTEKLCGHFSNISQVKSYEFLKRQHLFLASTLNSGTALSVYRQGEVF